VRALEESAALSRRLQTEPGDLRERFAERARTQIQHAQRIKNILLRGPVVPDADPQKKESEDR
jgi:hypothetical protein